jgi:ubiquinone/menaquinone biosynthesis C-methylase UbiE
MDFIKQTWARQAVTHGASHVASWGDIFAINLEIETIGNYIKKGDAVLDVGCANGFSAFNQLKKLPSKIVGVDFVPQMIEHADREKQLRFANENITFEIGDVRTLQFPNHSFDVVYTTRVLINLASWEEQQQGILECLRVTKKGGVIVLSEAFWEPLVKLNALRTLAGLPSLVEHDFNRYLKKSKLSAFLKDQNLTFEIIPFSSLYYLGSRFIRELVEDLKDPENYQNEVNEMFFDLEKKFTNSKDFGIQQAFVIHP